MPEVFSAIFFVSWPHDRKAVFKTQYSSVCFNLQNNRSSLITINWKSLKKLLAVFSTAGSFALPEIYLEKGCDQLGIIA